MKRRAFFAALRNVGAAAVALPFAMGAKPTLTDEQRTEIIKRAMMDAAREQSHKLAEHMMGNMLEHGHTGVSIVRKNGKTRITAALQRAEWEADSC